MNTLKLMMKKSLYVLKIDNYVEYKKFITSDLELLGFRKILISIDHIYSRAILIILIKLGRTTKWEVFSPLS